jgi:UDP-N-acetyl-D-glucosamine dehydrogenase
VSEHAFRAALASDRITFSTDLESVQECDVVTMCMPVPIRSQTADLGSLEETCRRVGRHLRPGQLVIVESTAAPGTTEELVRPALEASGLSADHDFLLAYSPERIDPANEQNGLSNTPRIVGGMTREASGVAALLFGQFVDKVVQVSSCRAAEMAKFLENTFRHVNIGLVNEMARFCNEQGIDVWEVIDASTINRFGFMPFSPGSGGGDNGAPFDRNPSDVRNPDDAHRLRLLSHARTINSEMPEYVSARIERSLNERGRTVSGARILALGVMYKSGVVETFESPALEVMNLLKNKGARIAYHDPYVPEVMLNGDLLACSLLTERSVEAADCVAILTSHSSYDLDWVARHAQLIFDARNAFGPDRRPNVVRL